MSASQKMSRKQFLLPPHTVARLDRLAASKGTSASDIVRQAIEAFDEDSEIADASDLADVVSASLKEAIESTREARLALESTLGSLSRPGS